MALIKCLECGKEISDKAKQCIHCGNPIFQEKVKIMKKKKWEDLNYEEKNKIVAYRKTKNNWWESNRAMVIICAILTVIFLLMSCISNDSTFMFMSFISLFVEFVFSFNSFKEQKKWYEDNVDRLYEDDILIVDDKNSDEKIKNTNTSNNKRMPIALTSISIAICLIGMIIMLLNVDSEFYISVLCMYLSILIPNIVFLILSINKQNVLKKFKTTSIILFCISIVCVIVVSVVYAISYDKYEQKRNNLKEEFTKEFMCKVKYDGSWIGDKCYYTDYRGRTKTIIP